MTGPWEQYKQAGAADASESSAPWEAYQGSDADDGSRALPAGVEPSQAGGGRGFVQPPDAEDLTRPAGALRRSIERTPAAAPRQSVDERRTRSPGRVTDADIPDATAGSVARDIASGALQIGPTAVKSVADLARLATGDTVGKGLSDAMEGGMQSIREVVGSERAQLQRKRFQQDMADPALNGFDVIDGNPGALADQVLPTLGSMAVPVGAAALAGKAATAGRAAQVARAIDEATVLERADRARQAAGIGATVLQNAGDTFSTIRDAGGDLDQSYLGAAITAPATYVAGRVTGGGAEAAVARGMAGRGTAAGAVAVPRAMISEGAQEMGEQAGQSIGETVGKGAEFDANTIGKELAVAGTLGAAMGGGVNVAQQAPAMAERIARMRAGGEKAAADLLQRRLDQEQAAAAAPAELGRLREAAPDLPFHDAPDFQNDYTARRQAGTKPAEAAAWAGMTATMRQAAPQLGLSDKALAAALKKAEGMEIDQVPGFVERYARALASRGVIPPIAEGVSIEGVLGQVRDRTMTAAADASYPADSPRATMDAIAALEQAGATQGAIGSGADDGAATTRNLGLGDGSGTGAGAAAQVGPAGATGGAADAQPVTQPADGLRPGAGPAGADVRAALPGAGGAGESPAAVDPAVHAAATSPHNDLPEPTQAQKDAGNYKVGRMRIAGMDLSIENPEGSVRRGTAPDGTAWETPMRHHYGYIRGTTATDGDKLDVFVVPGTAEDFDGPVFVVDQVDPDTGKLDEHKVILGAKDAADAEAIYRANYTADWQGFGAMTSMPMGAFQAWAKSGSKKRPLGRLPDRAAAEIQTLAPDQLLQVARGEPGPWADAAAAELKRRETDYMYRQRAEDVAAMRDADARPLLDEARDQQIAQADAIDAAQRLDAPTAMQLAMQQAKPLKSRPAAVTSANLAPALASPALPAAENVAQTPAAPAAAPAAPAAPQFTYKKQTDGTLRITGDAKAIRAQLAEFGIGKTMPARGGVIVGKSQAARARDALDLLAKPAVQPTGPVRDVEIEKTRAANAAVNAAFTGDAAPALAPDEAARQRQESAAAKRAQGASAAGSRAAARAANPMRAFLGQHGISLAVSKDFAPGRAELRSAMVQGFGPVFRRAGLPLDQLAERAVEEGFLREPDVPELESLISRALAGERIIPQFAEGVAETEMDARIARERQFEEDAAAAARETMDDDLDVVLDAVESNTSEDDFLRALGASEEEIEDARREREARAARGAGVEAGEAATGEAPRGAEGGAAQTGPDGTEGRDDPLTSAAPADPAPSMKVAAPLAAEAAARAKPSIVDAGEKIGGARKDRWKDRGLDLSDLDAMSEGEGAELATKANVWKPDWKAIVDGGMDAASAATAKVIYDRLAAQPKDNTPAGRRRYVRAMQAVRRIYSSLTPENLADANQRLLYDELGWTEGRSPKTNDRARANAAGVEDLAAHMREARAVLFSVYKGRSDPFYLNGTDLRKIRQMLADGFPAKAPAWTRRFVVAEEGGPGLTPRGIEIAMQEAAAAGTPIDADTARAGYFVVRSKLSRKTLAAAATKADAEAAAAVLHEKAGKSAAGAGGPAEPQRPHLDALLRAGLAQRLDRDATAEDFVQDFGFRGIEFGNWSAQDERQRIINMAYDGLADLAELMGVPLKAMSLNGTMGLAFGARGGGRFAAHYEPGRLVINMTKIRGGGSMAHEWAHALDHYFGELDRGDAYQGRARGASGWNDEGDYSGKPRTRMVRDGADWKKVAETRLANLRPEMAAAFDRVMSALFQGQVGKAVMVRDAEQRLERAEARAAGESDPALAAMYREGASSARAELERLRQDPDDKQYPRGRTEFAGEAAKLSGGNSDGYWLRPTEMFARAFESWVFDRLAAMGARSDYLVHGVESDRFAGGAFKGNPYPVGPERARINEAFDALAASIQTRQTEKGVAMFARGGKAAPDTETFRRSGAPSSAMVAAAQARVEELTRGWKNGPRVSVVETPADLPVDAPPDVRGYYDGRGGIYIVAGTQPLSQIAETLAHEAVAHAGLRGLLGRDGWRQFVNTMQLALKTGNVPLRQLQAKVRAAYVDDDGRFNLSPAQEVDEIAALAVERGVDPTTGQFRPGFSWLKSLWAKAAQYLRGIGIDVPFTMSELHGMLAAAAQHLREGSADGRGAGMVPSAAARASGLGADRAYARGDAQAEPLPTAIVGDTLGSMNRLPDYPAAKAGNLDAAERVARSVVTAELAKKVRAAIGDSQPLVVPVVAEEAAGRNKIPRAAAEVLAARMGLTAVRGIAQANHARRTSLDGLARIFAPVEFTGRVEAGRDYLLLDDTLTQGGTFAALADHIRQGGGRVVGVVALTGKQYSATLAPSAETLQKLRDQHGDLEQDFRAATGYGYGHLTQSEARYLASFKPADALRARIVEEGRRARERGNAPAAGGQPPDVEGGAFARGPGAATAPVQAGPDWESMEPGWTDRVIYEAQDSRIDLKRTQEAIAAAGRNIDERFDARLAETLYPGRVARRSQQFLESEVKPLLESMARNKVSMDELADYLHARGAAERNAQIAKVNPKMPDGGAGTNTEGVLMTNAAAAAHLAKIVPLRRAVLDSLARKVDAITGGTRRLLVTEGLEKQETIDAWEAAYKHYVPMFRDEAASGAPHPQGSGFSVRGGSAKRATGSTKEVTNILAHVLMQREAAITRAEKNRVGLSLYGLALANPNPDFWTTIRPGMAAAQIASELTTMGVDPVVAEAGMQGVPTIRTVDPITNKVVDRPNPIYKSMPGAITLKVNGEDRVLLLNERDPRALRMAESLKNLDGLTRFDLAGSIIGKTTRWMAAVNTQFNPVFGVVNAVRDLQGGVINLTSTPLRGRQAKVFWNAGAAAAAVWREESGGKSSKWGALYRQFQEDGGQTGFRDMFRDANDRAKAIEKELAGLGKSRLAPGRAAHAVLDVLDVFNTTTENAVRLSAYAAALDEGMSRPAAARLARELTVDFNRKGRTGREAGPLYAFLNASVQGTERTVRALKGPAGRRIIAGGLALGMMQALLLAWAGYDEDEIPEFTKTRALVIPLSRNGEEKRYITIPLALGLHVLPNTGRIITELAIGDRRKIREKLTSAVGELAGAFNPLGGGNVLTADGLLRTALPTVADPIVELGFNKDFAGRPIEREAFDGEKDQRPGFSRAREGTLRSATGQVYTGLSKAINTVTGGSPYEAGGLSPTPERLRYLAQLAGGGVLREAEKLVNVSVAAAAGDPIKPGAVPLTSRFYGMVDADAVERARYFEAGRRIDQAESSLKAAQKAGDAEAMMRIMDAHPEVALAKAQAAVQREIGKLNKLAVTTIGDREQSQLIDAARVARMRALNDSVRALEEAAAGKPTLAQRLRGGVWRAEDVAAAQP